MKIDIRYPLLFSALPPRCSGRKDVFVSYRHTAEVPEISAKEIATVFEAATETRYRLVEFDGKLLRKIGDPGDETVKDLLARGFQNEDMRNFLRCFTFENGKTPQKPLSQALNNILCHRLYLSGDNRQRELETWPFLPVITGMAGRRHTRDDFRFEDLERKLSDINGDEFTAGRADHAAEAGKLVLIEGELWAECTPPAIVVKHEGYATSGRMVMELAHLPDWLDSRLDRQYFPIFDHAAAVEYAARATTATANKTSPFEDYTSEIETVAGASHLLSFDPEGYNCTRTALVLGGDVARWLANTPDMADKIGESRGRAVLLARDLAKTIGTNVSSWPDTTDLVQDVTDAWKMTGRKPGWADIPQNRHAFGTLICERAADAGNITVFTSLKQDRHP
jgi:hypothetical protein